MGIGRVVRLPGLSPLPSGLKPGGIGGCIAPSLKAGVIEEWCFTGIVPFGAIFKGRENNNASY